MKSAASTGVGVGLRWDFIDDLVERIERGDAPDVPFFEVTPENHMRRGGIVIEALDKVAARYPLISHGLILSIGSTDPLDKAFLSELHRFLERYDLPFHSDHLCFCGVDGRKLPDLLPLPQSRAAVRNAVLRIREARDRLERPFAIENISYYLTPGAPEMPESAFITEVLEEADCSLLLDVNNVFVNSKNFGFDPWAFICELPLSRVIEIHVAGHTDAPERGILIDTHGAGVCADVHELLRRTIARTGPVKVILERDNHLPPLDDLLAEAAIVRRHYEAGCFEYNQSTVSRSSKEGHRVPDLKASLETAEDVGTSRLVAVERAVQRLATSEDAPEDPIATFTRWSVHEDDARALGSFSRERTGVYGGLIGRTVLGAIQNQLPITSRCIEASALIELVRAFLREEPPKSPYLRDVPFELASWAAPRWPHANAPPYVSDLARFELLAFAVGSAERGERPKEPAPLAADRGVLFDNTVHLACFEYEAHLLFAEPSVDKHPRNEEPIPAPARRDVSLACYRDSDNEVCWVELAKAPMETLCRLASGAKLGVAIQDAARSLGRAVDANLIDEISRSLADLADRGALWGGAPPSDPSDLTLRSPYRDWLRTGKI